MKRIMSSAVRPIRLHGPRALPLATAAEKHAQPQGATRAATTYSSPSKPTPSPPRKPISQSPYKRSATTASSSSSPSTPSSSSSSSSPATAAATKPPTSAYAASQLDPLPPTPYTPPPNAPPLPGAPPSADAPGIDWSSSFHGLSTVPFAPDVAAVLMKPIPFEDVEVKPDGIIYLPEIKYRRILNQAFGPGGWGMAPRGDLAVGEKVVTREYALLVHGRYVPGPFLLAPFPQFFFPVSLSLSLPSFPAKLADEYGGYSSDSLRKPAASANSLAMTTASPPLARGARVTR